MTLTRTITLLLSMWMAACGASGTNGGSKDVGSSDGSSNTFANVPDTVLPANRITTQENITTKKWEEIVAVSEQLGQVTTQFSSDGFKTMVSAGVVEDDANNVLHWAVYSDGNVDDPKERIAAKSCDVKGDCKTAKITLKNGDIKFSDANGVTMDSFFSGAPSLAKTLEGFDHDGKTVLSSALNADAEILPDLKKRRFIVANAFGSVFGLDMSSMQSLATDSKAFTDIEVTNYVRASVIKDALLSTTPFDVLVWVGASVREKIGNNSKTIGMTANRGAYGDETVTSQTVQTLLKDAQLGGPGFVLLVGEESRGDGSDEYKNNLSLYKEFSEQAGRIVVAFDGRGETEDLIDASNHFLAAYFGGKSLAESLQYANDLLTSRGSSAKIVTNRESIAAEQYFTAKLSDFWGATPPPEPTRVTVNVYLSAICEDPQKKTYQEKEGQASFFVDATFDGPFFSGARISEDVELDVTVDGALMGTEVGDAIFVRISGDLKSSVKGINLVGQGQVVEAPPSDDPKLDRLYFNGDVDASKYKNDKGDTCQLKKPTLTTSTSSPSWMSVFPVQ